MCREPKTLDDRRGALIPSFRRRYKAALCLARSVLSRGIKAAKRNYASSPVFLLDRSAVCHGKYQVDMAGDPSADIVLRTVMVRSLTDSITSLPI